MFDWFRRLLGKFSTVLTAFFDSRGGQIVTDAIEGALKTAGSTALNMLLEEAKKQVQAVDAWKVPGETKAESVQGRLVEFATRVGITVSMSLINYAIETAVQARKAN